MRCKNKECDTTMMTGISKCPLCGKRTYFYLKHPQALLMMILIFIGVPIVLMISTVLKILIGPFLLINTIIKPEVINDDELIDSNEIEVK